MSSNILVIHTGNDRVTSRVIISRVTVRSHPIFRYASEYCSNQRSSLVCSASDKTAMRDKNVFKILTSKVPCRQLTGTSSPGRSGRKQHKL